MSFPFSHQKLLLDQLSIPVKLIESYKKFNLNEIDLTVILQILNLQKNGDLLPSFDQISSFMTITANEVANVLKKLRNLGYLTIDQFNDDDGIVHEWYSITPLIEKIYGFEEVVEDNSKEEGKLFNLFEQEFGRALSPIEIEMISYWIDDDRFKPALIKAALREAVLLGKLNFRYIDRILAEWKKKGIRSVQEVKSKQDYREKNQNKEIPKRDTSVYYNWLEE